MRHEECGFGAGSVLLSFLLGGLVGAGLALLVAPQSGPETRKRIREFSDDVVDKATTYAGQAREKATTYASQARDKVTTTLDKARDVYEEKRSALTAAVEAGKEAYGKEVQKEPTQ
jgi:gas vesicle protein